MLEAVFVLAAPTTDSLAGIGCHALNPAAFLTLPVFANLALTTILLVATRIATSIGLGIGVALIAPRTVTFLTVVVVAPVTPETLLLGAVSMSRITVVGVAVLVIFSLAA